MNGWMLDRPVPTKTGILVWAFFESRGAAEQEAARMNVRAVPASLVSEFVNFNDKDSRNAERQS